MRKLVAAINMALDGFCDHTAGIATEELHEHYTKLLDSGGVILYGRITYQMMESYWPTLLTKPTGTKSMDDFARAIDNIPKLVFSNTLTKVSWKTATLTKRGIQEEVSELKKLPGNDILVGSPSLIAACTQLNLVDEYQLCIHPVIAGKGLPLFKNINDQIILKLIKTKTFGSGAVLHFYEPTKK